MNAYRGAWLTLVGALGLSLCASARAEKADDGKPPGAEAKSQFVRLVRDGETPIALETAIVRFTPTDAEHPGLEVDLVAAVHVAEKSYYEELNRRFAQYDAVLYELVAPEGTRVPKGGGQVGNNPVSMLQNMMTNVLKLEFQLKGVDYTAKNFVHADLSPEQFARSMDRRGESVWTIMLRMMGYAMAKQGGAASDSDAQLLMALFDKNRSLALKRMMAEQFEDLEGALDAIGGPDGTALIADRNQAALKVLRQQIDAGKKRIAIFYGGGHMPDFEQRLQNDFGLVPGESQWLVAWDMKK
jgi:hypothetical protein